MTLIKIKLINGEPMGRPVIKQYIPLTEEEYNEMKESDQVSLSEYPETWKPAPGCEESDGVEAELVWQRSNSNYKWIDCVSKVDAIYSKRWSSTRQIWRLSHSQKVEVKEVPRQSK